MFGALLGTELGLVLGFIGATFGEGEDCIDTNDTEAMRAYENTTTIFADKLLEGECISG